MRGVTAQSHGEIQELRQAQKHHLYPGHYRDADVALLCKVSLLILHRAPFDVRGIGWLYGAGRSPSKLLLAL